MQVPNTPRWRHLRSAPVIATVGVGTGRLSRTEGPCRSRGARVPGDALRPGGVALSCQARRAGNQGRLTGFGQRAATHRRRADGAAPDRLDRCGRAFRNRIRRWHHHRKRRNAETPRRRDAETSKSRNAETPKPQNAETPKSQKVKKSTPQHDNETLVSSCSTACRPIPRTRRRPGWAASRSWRAGSVSPLVSATTR